MAVGKRNWVLSGVPLLLITAAACGYSLTSGVRPPPQAAGLAERRPQKDLCGSRKAQQELKARVFAEADGIRGPGLTNLDLLSSFTSVRVEEPLLKSRDADLDVTVCTGRFVLLLPPGAERGLGGRRYLHADVEYAALPASDGSGLVYQVRGADPIIYRLAAFNLRADKGGFSAATDFAGFDPAELLPPQALPPPALPPQTEEGSEPFPDPPAVITASLETADEPEPPVALEASATSPAPPKRVLAKPDTKKVVEAKPKKEAVNAKPSKRPKKEAIKTAGKAATASKPGAEKPKRTEVAAAVKNKSKMEKAVAEKAKPKKGKSEKQLAKASKSKDKTETASIAPKQSKEPRKDKAGKPKPNAKLEKDAKPKASKAASAAKAIKSTKGAKAAKPTKLAKSDVLAPKATPAPAPTKKIAKPAPRKAAAKPTPGCDAAASVTDRLLCGNPKLAAKKRAASNFQNAAMEEADSDTRRVLNRTRGQFADYVHRCASESCLEEAYEQRMQEIREIMETH